MSVVSKLQIVLEATTTAFDRGLRSATHTLNGFARQVGTMHDRMDGFARRNREALQGLQTAGAMAGVGLGAMALGLKGAVDEAVQFESAMAKVNKVMDFDTPEALQNMRKELEKLTVSGTSTFVELAQIAEAGGQLGVLEKDLIPFVSMVSDMATAFDMSADVAGDAMAKLANVWNKPIQQMSEFGDMINLISNNTPAKASQIVEALGRIGGTAKAFGLSEQGAVSLTSAMIGLGKAPEVASRAINHMLGELAMLDLNDKSVSASIKQLGFDVDEFGKLLKTNAEEALFVFLEAMNKLPKDEQIGFSVDMFGKNFGDDILALATAPELLEKIRTLLSDNANYAGSMTKEAAVLSATTEGQIKKFQNNISVLKANIGDVFLPVLNETMEKLTPILQAVSEWATQNAELVKTIAMITAGVLGVIATLGSLALAFTAVTSGIGAMIAIGKMIAVMVAPIINAIGIVKLFGSALVALGFPVTAVLAGITALVVAGVALYKNWDTIKARAVEIFGNLPAPVQDMARNIKAIYDGLVAFLKKAFDFLVPVWTAQFNLAKTVATGAFDFIKGYIGAWVASTKAILTAGLTVFASVFNAGFALIKNAFTTAFNVIKALVRGDMQGVANAIRTGLSNTVSIIRTMITNIVGAFKNLGSQLLQAGRDAIQGFINGVKAKMGEALATARQMASQVVSTVKSALDIHSPSRVMRELGAWAGEGFVLGVGDKVGDAKQVAENLANALTSTVQDLHRQNFMLLNTANPLADLEYKLQFGELAELTDKQKTRLRELAKVNLDIQKANEKTANAMREQQQSAERIANANDRSAQNYANLQKQIALFGNQSKLAEFDYDWKNGAFGGADNMLVLRERSAIAELERLQHQDKTKTAFNQMQGGLAGELSPLAKLQQELDDRLQIIQDFENAHTGVELEAQKARQQAEEAYLTAKNNLMLNNYQNVFNGISGLTKSFFGEQSGIYRTMFAMEKGFAIAKAILALKANIAEASKIGFPQNIPMIAGAVSQGVAIVNDIRSIAMPMGQAHDGIMSVPKSGTWNLEKGERVLPKHTAQNLDNTLNRLQGNGGGQVINISVTVNNDGGDVQSSHDMGKNLGHAIKLAVQTELQKERRQGGLLYGR